MANYTAEELKREHYIKGHDIMLSNAETDFTSINFNTDLIVQGFNEVIEYESMIITLTTIQNQKKDMNNSNVTAIDIKVCEKALREAYTISDDEILFMKKVEVKEEGMKYQKLNLIFMEG